MKPGVESVFLKASLNAALLCCGLLFGAYGQGNIAVGSWRVHANYQNIRQLCAGESTVFALGEFSLFYYSIENPSPIPLTKLDGLYSQDIRQMAFDQNTKTLILSHPDGTIDLVSEAQTKRLNDIRTNSLIQNKNINRIRVVNRQAWLAGDFGLASIDLEGRYIQQAFLNIGTQGTATPVADVTSLGENLYISTPEGLFEGNRNANLNDFNHWRKIPDTPPVAFSTLASLENTLFLLGEDHRLYQLNNGTLEWIIGASEVNRLREDMGRVYFSMDNSIYQLLPNGDFHPVENNLEDTFKDFLITGEETHLAIPGQGVLVLPERSTIFPNSIHNSYPRFQSYPSLTFALPSASSHPNSQVLNLFEAGVWQELKLEAPVRSLTHTLGKTYIGSPEGLWQYENGRLAQIENDVLASNQIIEALATDGLGKTYAGVQAGSPKLVTLNPSGNHSSLEINGLQSFMKIVPDIQGNIWIIDSPGFGRNLRVINPETGLDRTLGNTVNQGGLPGSIVQDVFMDIDRSLWVATNQGIGYIHNPAGITQNQEINAVLPIFQNRQVLANVSVTQILIAPDRSIWVGTENQGLWHFSPDFESLLQHFTSSNSPLPGNSILFISMDADTGELFISTASGALSYRSESMRAAERLENLKIYPNPVKADFNGVLSIEGITDYATLKISHSSGRVVASMQVLGGKITWNLRTPEGNRISPGIYFVYVLDESGRERLAGKFLVI